MSFRGFIHTMKKHVTNVPFLKNNQSIISFVMLDGFYINTLRQRHNHNYASNSLLMFVYLHQVGMLIPLVCAH